MTIKEIAQLAGVSISTVSKIMNHKDASISADTRARVLRVVKEFNYSPYSSSVVNSSGKTFILGILIRSAGTNLTLNGIISAARYLGYTVLIAESADSLENECKGITALCRHGVDGVLWEPVSADSLIYASSFHASNIPYLMFNSFQIEGACNIDFAQMGYDATARLIASHHTDIACLLSPGTRTDSFLSGYRKCLFDKGIPYQENLVFKTISGNLLHKITKRAITGIVNSHFATALQLYGSLNDLHYQIPYDVSLISLRDDAREITDFPRISTLTIPHFKFGGYLCRRLIQMIENGEPEPDFDMATNFNDTYTIDIPFTKKNRKLIVVGSINIDNYLKVDKLPSTGKAIITSTSCIYPGGKGINQSIGAAKLGVRTALIGNVGNDVDSDLIFATLTDYAVDSTCVRRNTEAATGKAYIFVQRDGDSMISILSGANSLLTPEDILRSERLFENSSYCLVQTEVAEDAVLTACRLARKYGVKTILKPSACASLSEELLSCVDILVPNFDEINTLCPKGDFREQASYFLNKGIETVIITLGQEGCYVKTEKLDQRFAAASFQTIDNTGAGDAFIAALAVYLQYGYELQNAVQIATYAAGFSVTREGVPPSLIDKNTLESYISQVAPDLLKH